MKKEVFAGDKKEGDWLLKNIEARFIAAVVPRVPSFLETYHLTLLTIVWSVLIVWFSSLAKYELSWLWLVSLCIALQYLTDALDGAVGRYRKTGLIKWGFFMDHLLDYIFFSSIIAGYAFLFNATPSYWFFLLLAAGGALMVNSFLIFSATNEFRISFAGIGPSEGRMLLILLNTCILLGAKDWVEIFIPLVAVLLVCFLVVCVYRAQGALWILDMKAKK